MANPQATPFIRNLASSDPDTRDEAMKMLRQFVVPRTESLAPLEHIKLQKGLFYALYMCDKIRAQQLLSLDIASLVNVLPGSTSGGAAIRSEENVWGFLEAYWSEICSQWSGIDRYRMDKYLFGMRVMFRASLLRVKSSEWKNVDRWTSLMEKGPLHPTSRDVPDAIRYHLLDLWVDEIEGVVGEEDVDEETMQLLAEPLELLQKDSKNKTVRNRAKEVRRDARLSAWLGEEIQEDTEPQKEDEFAGFD